MSLTFVGFLPFGVVVAGSIPDTVFPDRGAVRASVYPILPTELDADSFVACGGAFTTLYHTDGFAYF